MDKKTQAYLDFLRFSINENTEVPSSARNIDWEGLLQFGTKQCVRGVLFLGMKKLGTTNNHPSFEQLGQWLASVSAIKKANVQV